MTKANRFWVLSAILLATASFADAQQRKIFRVGVITTGGAWYQTIDGLRVGLREGERQSAS